MSIFSCVYSQENQGFIVPAKVVDGDTMLYLVLEEVIISPPNPLADIKNKPKYSKLIRDVKKVYHYAVIAGVKLKEYNELLLSITDEGEKKKTMK